jgi:triosephosphate isomerase
MNPVSRGQKESIISVLNSADLDSTTGACFSCICETFCSQRFAEIVIAPPSLYLIPLKDTVRSELQVSAQNCYFKDSGAFTGEIRQVDRKTELAQS